METNQELTLTIQEKSLRDGSKIYMIVDSKGCVCGIHSTEETANKAIPVIKYNIGYGRVPKQVLRQVPSYTTPECLPLRQVYKKK